MAAKIWNFEGLETLTFDPLTSKCYGLPSCRFLAGYALPFSTYGQAWNRWTDRWWSSIHNASTGAGPCKDKKLVCLRQYSSLECILHSGAVLPTTSPSPHHLPCVGQTSCLQRGNSARLRCEPCSQTSHTQHQSRHYRADLQHLCHKHTHTQPLSTIFHGLWL